jgi:hypothetical protein
MHNLRVHWGWHETASSDTDYPSNLLQMPEFMGPGIGPGIGGGWIAHVCNHREVWIKHHRAVADKTLIFYLKK